MNQLTALARGKRGAGAGGRRVGSIIRPVNGGVGAWFMDGGVLASRRGEQGSWAQL